MADSQRKSYNLFDKSQISSITTPIGDRYGSIFESAVGTYTLDVTGTANRGDYLYADKVLSDGTSGARYYIVNNGTKTTTQLTISNDDEKFLIYNASGDNLSASQAKFDRWLIMLNSGSTAKPYEPYGWVHSLRKLGTATETIQSGDTIYANGQPITTYTLKGNTVQDGTPTPSNPVDVNGVGNKTANLLNQDESTQGDGYLADSVIGINNQGQPQTISTPNFFVTEYISVNAGTYYYYSDLYRATGNLAKFMFYNANKEFIGYTERQTALEEQPVYELSSFSAPANTAYMRMNIDKLSTKNCLYTSQLPSYEPYGQYKIPILTAQGSAVNYLGSVSSNRQIYKLVLDGTENYGKDSGGTYLYYKAVNPTHAKIEQCLCTHLPNASDYPRDSIGIYATKWANNAIYFNFGSAVMDVQPSGNTVAGLKEYLAAQYAAGTPVTIWYILETPTTGIVNEPLMKIGTYADTLSNAASIPTTEGANTITVDTTVQPSEFTATWSGWHDASVKEKSENLFDKNAATLGKEISGMGYINNPDYFITDFIPIASGETYSKSGSSGTSLVFGGSVLLYDEADISKTPLYKISAGAAEQFTIPQGDYNYMVLNGRVNIIDLGMINQGSTALPYAPYWK